MKNLAKLALFFTISFIVIFSAILIIRIFAIWVEIVRIIPVTARPGEDLVLLAWKKLPAAIYLSILISLSYSVRRNMSIGASIICIVFLALIFSGSLALGLRRADDIKPALNPVNPIRAGPGLLLGRGNSSIILLRESANIRGPRLVSFPNEPLIYQELPMGPNNTIIPLPPLPLGSEVPWFIQSIEIDFNLGGTELKSRYQEDYLNFTIYIFSLILLLASMRFVLQLSQWPMANLFIGALVFRGILALEVFINSREINTLIHAFLDGRLPSALITPLVFCTFGILVILYTILTSIARQPHQQRSLAEANK